MEGEEKYGVEEGEEKYGEEEEVEEDEEGEKKSGSHLLNIGGRSHWMAPIAIPLPCARRTIS